MLLLKNCYLCIKEIIQKDDQTDIAQNMAIWKLQEKNTKSLFAWYKTFQSSAPFSYYDL